MPDFNLKIAGQVGHVTCLFDSTPYYLARYTSDDAADFSVVIGTEDLERERQFRDAEALEEGMKLRKVTEPFLERLAIQRKFAEELMGRGILMVHGSAVAVDGVGYIFTAACGTGKSTHTRLWRQVFGDRAVMINDDKPFLRISPDGVTVCGAPWSGKHGLDTNTEVPLGGVCLLERGGENVIRPIFTAEIPELCRNLRWFMEPERVQQFDALAVELARRVPLWHMNCNMDPDAAGVSHAAMSGGGAEMIVCYLDKSEKDLWLPRMFDLFYENMKEIAPTGLPYEQEKTVFFANVSPALDKAPRQVLLALDGQKLAGYVQFYTRNDLLMVEEVQLRREYQGTLLFLRLCRKLLTDLPEEVRTVEAYAHRQNDRSRKLMKRLGLWEVPEESPFVHLRGDVDAVKRMIINV